MKLHTVLLVMLSLMVTFTAAISFPTLTKPAVPTRPPKGKPTATWTFNSVSETDIFAITFNSEQRQGQFYYVAPNGYDSNPGTEAQPFRTINHGITVLEPGNTLYVKSGTYAEAIRTDKSGTSWDAPITIKAYPGDTVTIKPLSGTTVVTVADSHYIILDGFIFDGDDARTDVIKLWDSHHIRIQNSEVKGAVNQGILLSVWKTNYDPAVSGNNEFINLNVHDNGTTEFDHGLYIATSSNHIDRCSIHHNAGFGIHLYQSGCSDCVNNNIASNNTIYDNARAGGSGSGIILSSGSGNLAYNNLVWGNTKGIQVAYRVSDAKVYNNVVYANDGDGIYMFDSSTNAVIRNNIVYQNGGWAISDEGSGTIQDHNLVKTDPQFVDISGHDFHLQPTSPAINAGIALSEVPDDFDGVSRPRGGGFDIGAYEFPFSFRVTDLRVVAADPDTSSLTVTLRWTTPFDALSYTLRSSSTPLTVANWSEAPIVTELIPASPPGTIEWLTIPVDYTGGTLYLALKSQNSEGAWSDLSNNAFWPLWDIHLPLVTKNDTWDEAVQVAHHGH